MLRKASIGSVARSRGDEKPVASFSWPAIRAGWPARQEVIMCGDERQQERHDPGEKR